jgi:hypothetical protein
MQKKLPGPRPSKQRKLIQEIALSYLPKPGMSHAKFSTEFWKILNEDKEIKAKIGIRAEGTIRNIVSEAFRNRAKEQPMANGNTPTPGPAFSSAPAPQPITPGPGHLTPGALALQQQLAMEMLKSGTDYSPIRLPSQGAARVADALFRGMMMRQAWEKDHPRGPRG